MRKTIKPRKLNNPNLITGLLAVLGLCALALLEALIHIGLPWLNYELFSSPKRSYDKNIPCPLPVGTYLATCSNVSSQLINTEQCNFTAICDTGFGKKYGIDARSKYAFGQYGDTCPNATLIYQEIALPTFMKFRDFSNAKGKINSALTARNNAVKPFLPEDHEDIIIFNSRKTTKVADDNCNIRKQLSSAETPHTSTAITTLATLAAIKLVI
jgi:hypothetical protein